jgi:CheY-like chemotaxis protein
MEKVKVKKILVVEDDRDIRETLVELLELDGYGVVSVGNGKEALDYLERISELPNLILLDMMMPIMNGWEFRSQQYLDPRLKQIPVIITTAVSQCIERMNQFKPEGFVKKPIDLEELLNTVTRCVT